jgi:CelD/BcsL family acetyltransferase involved in cellulose biosynthesis
MTTADPPVLRRPPASRAVERATVARSVADVVALRPVWERLGARHLDSDVDHFLAVVRSSPDVVRPHVLHLERPGREDLLVVARLVDQRMPLRIGYRSLGAIRVRALLVSFDGVLGAATDEDHAAALAALRADLKRGEADVVVFQKLPDDAPLWRLVHRSVPASQLAVSAPMAHHQLTTADTLDALLAQRPSKSRQRLRREMSVFRRDHEGRFEIRRLDLPENLSRLERDIETVAHLSYQRNLDLGSVDPRVQAELLAVARDRGWLKAWMLYLDDRPVSFWWGMRYRGVFEPGATAYDPAHHGAGVGFFTFMQMVDDLCRDPEVDVIDFGFGDAEYKRRFSTTVEERSDLRVYAPRPRALLVRGGMAAAKRAAAFVRRHEDDDWAQALKRRWRRAATDAGAAR